MVSGNPSSADDQYNEGNDLLIRGEAQAAQACYEKALEMDPDFTLARYYKGHALFTLRKYKEAIECYDTVLRKDPTFYTAWYWKGRAFLRQGKMFQANTYFGKFNELFEKHREDQPALYVNKEVEKYLRDWDKQNKWGADK